MAPFAYPDEGMVRLEAHGRGISMKRRRFTLAVEGMEARELLSVTAILATQHPLVHTASINGPDGTTLGQGDGNNAYLNPTGTPTAKEKAREAFVFTFSGAFRQGPGRFSNEASLIHINAVGSSTYFLNGDVQIGIAVPTDPTQPTSGVATSFDKNINANSVFGFDLSGSTATVDKAGRPTQFTAVTDVNISSGIFVESQSQATVTIKYLPDGKAHPKGVSEGRVNVVIKGFAYTLGTGNILGGGISRVGNVPSLVRA